MVNTDDSRRDFLRKAGIGAAVAGGAWVAPTVLTLDAAGAVGTCPGGNLSFSWATGHPDGTRIVTGGLVGNIGGATGVDVRIIGNTSTGVAAAGLVGDNWMTRGTTASAACPPTVNCGSAATTNFPRGGPSPTSFYSLLMNAVGNTGGTGLCTTCAAAGTTGRTSEVTFGFFNPGSTTVMHAVRNLRFSLYDVDSSNGNYRDQVDVFINGTATAATVPAQVTGTIPNAAPSVAIAAPGTAARWQAIAGQSADATSNRGNVDLAFNANLSITTVRVRFTDILGSAPQTVQWVGIGDLQFCKVAP